MSKPIEIQKNTNKWEIINWFSYFKYDNGIITCRFDKRLKPYPYLDIKKLFPNKVNLRKWNFAQIPVPKAYLP